MTRNEAEERAKKIWGEKLVVKVDPLESSWMVEIESSVFRCHILDENGHTQCHPACTRLEAEYCT